MINGQCWSVHAQLAISLTLQHTFVLPVVLVEALLVFHRYPGNLKAAFSVFVWCTIYIMWSVQRIWGGGRLGCGLHQGGWNLGAHRVLGVKCGQCEVWFVCMVYMLYCLLILSILSM